MGKEENFTPLIFYSRCKFHSVLLFMQILLSINFDEILSEILKLMKFRKSLMKILNILENHVKNFFNH
jgi:hypothetical protein